MDEAHEELEDLMLDVILDRGRPQEKVFPEWREDAVQFYKECISNDGWQPVHDHDSLWPAHERYHQAAEEATNKLIKDLQERIRRLEEK